MINSPKRGTGGTPEGTPTRSPIRAAPVANLHAEGTGRTPTCVTTYTCARARGLAPYQINNFSFNKKKDRSPVPQVPQSHASSGTEGGTPTRSPDRSPRSLRVNSGFFLRGVA